MDQTETAIDIDNLKNPTEQKSSKRGVIFAIVILVIVIVIVCIFTIGGGSKDGTAIESQSNAEVGGSDSGGSTSESG